MTDCIFVQEAGVHGSLTNIEEFSLALIPFDYDLMSMEMDNSFKVTCSSHILTYLLSKLRRCMFAFKNCDVSLF